MSTINIDVTNWEDEVKRNEIVFSTPDDLIDQILSGSPTKQAAIIAIISQMWGNLIGFREPKSNLYYGALSNVHAILKAHNKKAKINGVEQAYQEFIGPSGDNTRELYGSETYVESTSQEGMARARRNIQVKIFEYIKNQALILRQGGGDFETELRNLQDRIGGLISWLQQPDEAIMEDLKKEKKRKAH
jgi:hypothetical protein